jgi:hypothetical protein
VVEETVSFIEYHNLPFFKGIDHKVFITLKGDEFKATFENGTAGYGPSIEAAMIDLQRILEK